ncbi:MAG: acyltransferase [Clostridia bacterium]|nr:acyltransferase [Clostridia bacterium]
MENTKELQIKNNRAIDIAKLVLAFLVVAIHTEPFGDYYWLDKGFGLITRLCVPFFFVASSYFFFLKDTAPLKYIQRLFVMYLIWSVIYLPFDLVELGTMTLPEILERYLWIGNGHALWYLCGSIIGFAIAYGLSRFLSPRTVLVIAVIILTVGCLKSTYAPVLNRFLPIEVSDFLGSRNGLFYGFPYYALGMYIAKVKESREKSTAYNLAGFGISFLLLCVESAVMVVGFKVSATIIWLSVMPLVYFFFMTVKGTELPISSGAARYCRKLSTLIYLTHSAYIYILKDLVPDIAGWLLFLTVSAVSVLVSMVIILLGKLKFFKWLKYLY